jgi:hypothetical protein
VLKFEDPSGNRQNDVEKRALLEQLLGPLVITPVKDGRKAEVLELEYSLNTKALPAVLPTGKANAYILVAGVRCRRYQALVTALDILSRCVRSKTVKAPSSAP